jgi:hypothetical protein
MMVPEFQVGGVVLRDTKVNNLTTPEKNWNRFPKGPGLGMLSANP